MVVAATRYRFRRLYDNVYTQRFNGLITDNKAGYDRARRSADVDGMRGNLLLVHGGGDDNVHFQRNSEMLINALVAAGKPFEMMEYPNRTHCICQGKELRPVTCLRIITRFLDRSRLGGPASGG